MEKSSKHKGFWQCRYRITSWRNDAAISVRDGEPWTASISMAVSYEALISELQLELDGPGNQKSQAFRNHLSTLRGFLKSVGRTEHMAVGAELASAFTERLDTFVKGLVGAKPRSITDKKSHLRRWKRTAERLLGNGSSARPPSRVARSGRASFHKELYSAIDRAGRTPTEMARAAGMTKSAMQRWMAGAFPNATTMPALHRLEHALGLKRGHLSSLVSKECAKRDPTFPMATPRIAYRERMSAAQASRYVLPESEVSKQLAEEWAEYFDYHTTRRQTLRRHHRGVWALVPVPADAPSAFCTRGSSYSPGGDMQWKTVLQFLGFLRTEAGMRAVRLNSPPVQTLGWFAVPRAVDEFMKFLQQRAGKVSGTHATVYAVVSSMTHFNHGYLTQQPSFREKLPEAVLGDGQPWTEMCASALTTAQAWKRDASRTRDPSLPIEGLLKLPNPQQPVFRMIDALRAVASSSEPKAAARTMRACVLFSILLSNPLRKRNLQNLCIRGKGPEAETISKEADGKYWIRIEWDAFKTRSSSRRNEGAYTAELPEWVTPLLDEYILIHRPVLLGGSVDEGWLLLPDGKSGRWRTLDRTVRRLTKRYLPQCPGIGPHAFRNLFATYWLTNFSNDYVTVAEVLNDSLAVVMKSYAHLKKNASVQRYHEALERQRHASGQLAY